MYIDPKKVNVNLGICKLFEPWFTASPFLYDLIKEFIYIRQSNEPNFPKGHNFPRTSEPWFAYWI